MYFVAFAGCGKRLQIQDLFITVLLLQFCRLRKIKQGCMSALCCEMLCFLSSLKSLSMEGRVRRSSAMQGQRSLAYYGKQLFEVWTYPDSVRKNVFIQRSLVPK